MGDSLIPVGQCFPATRDGSEEGVGHAFEACRGYLLLIARQELEPALRAKGGASDLVQQTFLEAHKDLPHFRGATPEALLVWMRRLLLNNLANFRRDFRREKRHLSREVSLTVHKAHSHSAQGLRATANSPSAALVRDEETQALERALNVLPEDYRQVIHLRYREERSFEVIAQTMQRSPNAVRKLWARAIETLQQELKPMP